ncbi:MAG TPA: glycosyltransferase [Chloroflexi bacterium]|nr:glycosyltransferase [Chloroflexota bacterium]
MNILFLTQVLPYPPDAGPKFKTWQVLRYLMEKGHTVTLISMIRPEDEKFCHVVDQLVTAFYPVQIQRSRMKDVFFLLRSVLTGRPFLIERDDLREIRLLVERLVFENTYDAMHADQVTLTQFILPYAQKSGASDESEGKRGPVLLFDAHNATWKILERFASESRGPKRWFFQWEANRVRRYEADLIGRCDRILAVSDVDRDALREAAVQAGQEIQAMGKKFMVIPITVDTQEILPVKRAVGSLNVFTFGTLYYPPNADGIRWFINGVFPKVREAVPGVTLTVVGKNPPPDFLALQSASPDVFHVPGYVTDLTPWFEQAAVVIVPVRVGGGMRVRILEAFARAMPIVTTTVGLEGIDALPGEHILVEDDESAFAEAVIGLIKDEKWQNRLAAKGRQLAEQMYDQQVVLQQLDEIYPAWENA